ncbi:MAG: extracellular solute-binding protein, partial [Lachnospiraceae bacterium]|nr:extracellular solute-binding protein [Lachnospiraceae bacterium]
MAVSEHQKEFYQVVISEYRKLHPETAVTVEIIPWIDNMPTEKTEKNRKAVKDMQVQVLAGKGPDVFLLDESDSLLPDIVKSSYNGVFLDLNTVIDGIKGLPLNQTVVKAGEVDGKQYFL